MVADRLEQVDREGLSERPFWVLTERGRDVVDQPEWQARSDYGSSNKSIQSFPRLTRKDTPC